MTVTIRFTDEQAEHLRRLVGMSLYQGADVKHLKDCHITKELESLLNTATDAEKTFQRFKDGFLFDEQTHFSIEKHGPGWALYRDRSPGMHGLNLCNLNDFCYRGEETRRIIVEALNLYCKVHNNEDKS